MALAAGVALLAAGSGADDAARPGDWSGFGRFPRLADTDAPARRINRALARADSLAEARRDGCAPGPASFWERDALLTFEGPAFVSAVETVGYDCAGLMHPESYVIAMTFDRATGQRVDWRALLPVLPAPDDRAVRLPEGLRRAVLAAIAPVPPDCAPVLGDAEMPFVLWLDAARAALAVRPVGLARADAPCDDTAFLPAADLAGLGADPALVAALAAARP